MGEETYKCPKCGSYDNVWRGYRYNESGKKRLRKCKSCGAKFTPDDGFLRRRFRKQHIVEAVSLYQSGLSLSKVKIIEKPSSKLLENSPNGERYLEPNTFLIKSEMGVKEFQKKSSLISLDSTAELTTSSSTDCEESVNSSMEFQLHERNMD